MSHPSNRPLGLSLIELLLVVVLIGIIASVIVARVVDSTETAKIKSCWHNRMDLNSAIERYGIANGSFPSALSDLNVLDYFPGGIPACPVTGSAYSINATTNRIDGHTSNTAPGDH